MSLSARFAAQLSHPRGIAGRLLGQAMDLANRRPVQLAVAELAPRAGERVLDAGCGTGAALAAVRREARCVLLGVDRSASMIAAARRRLGPEAELSVQPIEDLPGDWGPFDGILALNVLYFGGPPGGLVAALHRSLRPGGRLVVYVTHRQSMQRWQFARAGLHRLLDAPALEAELVDGGFARGLISIKEHAITPRIRGLIAHAER